jgi:bifunctional oligoribonuclease and PAP phosphatase NrnA
MESVAKADMIQAFLDRVRVAKRPLIGSHVSPDGDAVGSILGLAAFLRQAYGIDAHCALQDPVPDLYQWLPNASQVTGADSVPDDIDLFIVADTHQVERTGSVGEKVGEDVPVIVIDHHIVRVTVPAHSYIDSSAAAVGEMVCELFAATNTSYTPEAATACYVALSTDTGCFRYPSTTARTHAMAADLIEAGVDVGDITERVFDTMSLPKFALLGRILHRVEILADGRAAMTNLTTADLSECGAKPEDTDGLINFLRNVDGVEIAVFCRETEDGSTKVSLRARPGIDVSAVARHFGGGGHAAAAGTTIEKPLAEACGEITEYIEATFAGEIGG